MGQEKKLTIQIYFIGDDSLKGPSSFQTWTHHSFALITKILRDIEQLGEGYRPFRPATGEFVPLESTFAQLHAHEGESFILTTMTDVETIDFIWEALSEMNPASEERQAPPRPAVDSGPAAEVPTKVGAYHWLGLPKELTVPITLSALLVTATPFLGGQDLGLFKVPVIASESQATLLIGGGFASLLLLLGYVPFFAERAGSPAAPREGSHRRSGR